MLSRKNPYLFRALGTEKASEIVDQLLRAYISSSDETIFGDAYFEEIAMHLPAIRKSTAEGIDLERDQKTALHVYSLKSGPNPFNSSQKAKQDTQFKSMQSRLYSLHKQFDPVLAHAYGRKDKPSSGARIYREVSGQKFWEELTGDSDFYLKLIRLMKDIPQKKKQDYTTAWNNAVNRFTLEFLEDFSMKGAIDWEKLTQFISGAEKPKLKRRKAVPPT